jgi:hypothetical protein
VPKPTDNRDTLLLRIELLDIEPLIWRRLRLPKAMRLDSLHSVIQIAFGWTDVTGNYAALLSAAV